MKVCELMDPKGILLYANIDNAADALGILVELQEGIGVITTVPPITMPCVNGKILAVRPQSARELHCPMRSCRRLGAGNFGADAAAWRGLGGAGRPPG